MAPRLSLGVVPVVCQPGGVGVPNHLFLSAISKTDLRFVSAIGQHAVWPWTGNPPSLRLSFPDYREELN